MRASDLTLSLFLDGSLFPGSAGTVGRNVLLDAPAFGLLRHELLTMLGARWGRDLLLRFGYAWGEADARRLRHVFDWDSDDEWLHAGPRVHALRGVVEVVVDRMTLDRGAKTVHGSGVWRRSVEAEEHRRRWGKADSPVCFLLSGYAAGYASAVAGAMMLCIEDSCAAMGDGDCRWRIVPATEADPATAVVVEAFSRLAALPIVEQERAQRRRLEAVNNAALALAGELSLPALLQQIADIARELTGARYAALGVMDDAGRVTQFITSGISAEQRARIGPLPQGHGLLGLILRGEQPLRLASIGAHPASHGFPPDHPPMTSFLGAPVVLRGRNLGNLYLTDKQDAPEFTGDDQSLVVQLATHAAIAIENARLYGQTSEALQQRVAELDQANSQLARLSALAITAQEEERRRLARELHDDTAQSLASILLRLRVLERSTDLQQCHAQVQELRTLVAHSLDDVRRMALDLRPSTLDDLGLGPAVESHARAFAEHWGLRVRCQIAGIERRLPRPTELIVYRIVQEALTNIAKHAQATEVIVGLERRGQNLQVMVKDNGRGFDVAATLASRERGLGLFGMEERAALAGGRVEFASGPGDGATITAVIPIREE